MALQSKVNFARIEAVIVDSNVHMRVLIKTILSNLGVSAMREAEDGPAAMEILQHFNANLLITELNMAPQDGLQLTKLIRTSKNSPCPYIPIIMMTGDTTTENIFSARDTGVDEFIAKPISAKSLLDRILAIVNDPRIFVNSEGYFGPDRRRQILSVDTEARVGEPNLQDRPDQFN